MKQVVQNFRTGELAVADVPAPSLKAGGVLVQTISSAVSAGTEKSKVELAQKSLVGKAMARPDQVRKVIDTLKKEGLRNTYNKVRNKLDALAPLGYSAAGRVIAVPDDTSGFSVGDFVACAGAGYANHAEMLWVPSNLCAPIPTGVSFDDAAFATIGAIALQGVRQAEVSLGETVVVIGLGLLGQLTVQLLTASGCRAIGVDVAPWKIDLARAHGASLALLRSDDVIEHVYAATDGKGADSIIITAATDNNDPFVLAGEVARDKAKVVLVGAVPIEVPRSPYYEKELDIRLSRSYGPGRYDRAYEENGIDYPVGYVRWTENRNMRAFLDAVAQKKVVLDKLITHRFEFANAHAAYDLIKTSEPFLGVVLKYADRAPVTSISTSAAGGSKGVGFIGAGSFAGGTLIPLLRESGVSLKKVCTSSGLTAADAAKRHGFASAVSNPDEVLSDPTIHAVVIASRHDSHADLTTRALQAGKTVFVEKPLALSRDELTRVMTAAKSNPGLMVGFNRRFSPHTKQVKSLFDGRGPLVVTIRVNAGPIPPDSWIHDPKAGGGRLLGEGCHFVDLAQHLVGTRIKRVFASQLGGAARGSKLRDNFVIHLDFEGGSLATITYTSKGDPSLGKERIEVFGAGMCAVIDDFSLTTIARGRKSEKSKAKVDKGHHEEIAQFVRFATSGGKAPIALDDLEMTSLATIAAVESLELGLPIEL